MLPDDGRADDAVFLFSSKTGVPRRFFQGFAFVGHDLVIGAAGAEAYAATGRAILPGEDGCYVSASTGDDVSLIGVDASGLKKLFLWQDADRWCVSNSLTVLRRHVEDAMGSRRLTPNAGQLAGLTIAGASATEQISHHESLLDRVRLVPLGRALQVIGSELREVAAPRPPAPAHRAYERSLRSFIDIWRARLLTLVERPGLDVAVDLSGGLDSRVTFSLLSSVVDQRRFDASARFVSGRGAAQRADLEVAQTIALEHGLTLNRRPRIAVPQYDQASAFDVWSQLNIGIYLPIYRPKDRLSAHHVNLSGLGGEGHRDFYPAGSPSAFVESYRSFAGNESVQPWRAQVGSLLQGWSSKTDDRLALRRYYREFRGRVHGGMFAQTKVNAMPLASLHMEPLSVRGRMAYFDIIASTSPGLLDVPFDSEAKAPTSEEHAAIIRAGALEEVEPGHVYGLGHDERAVAASDGEASFVSRLADLTERAVSSIASSSASELFTSDRLESALASVHGVRAAGAVRKPRELNDVSRVIAAAWALDPDVLAA